jgi:hypothetical protein
MSAPADALPFGRQRLLGGRGVGPRKEGFEFAWMTYVYNPSVRPSTDYILFNSV